MRLTQYRSALWLLLLIVTSTTHAYECDGRTRCSQMHSCAEATWFLNHCPNTQMDGDGDGVPCERQWCGADASPPVANKPIVESQQSEPSFFANHEPTEDAISQAFHDRSSNLQVIGSGAVEKILSDDNEGSRHQRFLVKVNSGIVVLVAHNIDLAPRVQALQVGSRITFYGVYEWNDKGGVIHWTHHDPGNRHDPGWIKYNGEKYQ